MEAEWKLSKGLRELRLFSYSFEATKKPIQKFLEPVERINWKNQSKKSIGKVAIKKCSKIRQSWLCPKMKQKFLRQYKGYSKALLHAQEHSHEGCDSKSSLVVFYHNGHEIETVGSLHFTG